MAITMATMKGNLSTTPNIIFENASLPRENEHFSVSQNASIYFAAEWLTKSWWNIFDEQYFRYSWSWTIALIVAYVLIFVVGVIGNSMVILVIILRPRMRSVTNMFIMNLAVADLFVIVFCVGPTLLANIFQPWILGPFMCKAVAYVQGVSVCASAYSLAVISMDRCQAIYGAFHRRHGLSKSGALRIICLIWVVALLITVPWAVIFDVIISNEDGFTYCVETWNDEHYGRIYFLIANLIFCYGLPLLLITVSNGIIWCHVVRRKVPQNTASVESIKKMHKKARHGVVKMLGIVTLTFLLSWLPLYIIVSRYKFGNNLSEWEFNLLDLLYPFAQCLGSSNSCVNPILYAFLNKKFREMFVSILPRCIPFVRRSVERRRMQIAGYGVAISNGNFAGSFRSRSCTTMTTRRSKCRTNRSFDLTGKRKLHRQNAFISRVDGSSGSVITTTLPSRGMGGTFYRNCREQNSVSGMKIAVSASNAICHV